MTGDLDHLRIGHAERERAASALQAATAEGRLELDELDARMERALAARTRGDLRTVLADLMSADALNALLAGERAIVAAPRGGVGSSWQDPLVLTARWDDVFRGGPWLVPPFLELNAVAATVKLNFVDARVSAPTLDVVVKGGSGDVVLVVPEGWGVDHSHLAKGIGSLRFRVPERPVGDGVQVVVRGKGGLGDVVARHPNGVDRWFRDRRLARGGGVVAKN